MDVAKLRQGILRALDEARKDASVRQTELDAAQQAYAGFLSSVAVPLFKQAAIVLRAEGHLFVVHTPAGSARLVSEAAPETFIESALDATGAAHRVLARVSLTRGRAGHILEEPAIGGDKPLADLEESDVTAYLLSAIPKVLLKR
jgi:hypothetical protein